MDVKVVVILLGVFISVSVVKSQNLGPNNCLISRTDIVPCKRVSPKKTRLPGPNQCGVYSTRFRQGSAGYPKCDIRNKDHKIRDIRIIGDKNKVRIIYSPGFTLEHQEKYGNQMLVNCSIKCEDGKIAFFNITNLDLEEKNCMDPNLGKKRCVDYVQVDRGGFGVTESCGTDASENTNQFELGNITIIFRTNSKNRYPGFAANIICFNRSIAKQEGCTRPLREGNDSVANEDPTMQQSGQRRKRNLEMFHEQWKRRAAYIERMKRQVGGDRFRFMEIKVTHGENVTYSNKKLEFIDNRNNKTIPGRSIGNIIFLHTYDANGDIDFFRGEAKGDSGALIRFPGPGLMFIVGRHAYFQLFVIDPRCLVPNAEEMAVLAKLTEAQLDVARENESERLDEALLNPDEPDFNAIGLGRRKRQADIIRSFDDEVVKVAITNEMACNPVLRTSANAILEYVEQTEPGRVNMLRKMLTTAPPTTLTQTSPKSTETFPTSTETSPTSTEASLTNTETSSTSTETSSTSTETSPTSTETSPSITETSPTSTETSPTSTETSPTSTETSPTSTETFPTSTETSPTSNETSPTSTETSPTSTETSPSSTETYPTSTETSPTSTEASPSSTETSLTSSEASPTSTETSPTSTDTSPIGIH